MSNIINFTIDGRQMSVEKGKTILYAATEAGIEIPTLCYNSKISKTTSCFVCVVKDKITGKFLPSCAYEPSEGQQIESNTDEVKDMRRTALNLLLSDHTGDCEAPCTVSCPAHANVEEYVREGKNGNFLESLKIIKERIPLPMSIGRVCPRFCEKDCRRNVKDTAVAINEFKRLAADLYYGEYLEECKPLIGKKIAIIGAGPAGLAAAYYLRLNGVQSDLYEKQPEMGGMLRYGIPEYRLPKNILNKELSHFNKLGGINIFCGKEVGSNLPLSELKSRYDAVVVTIGCWKSSPMQIEGEILADDGIVWLEKVALNGWNGENPGKVIVIGGGNTAMDCLRTSVRLGSKDVTCYYRRTENEMPAEKIEIKEAKEEGVKFEFLVAPLKITKNKEKLILTSIRMELGEPDASGRRKPIPVKGSEFDTEADCIIAAIGQKTSAFQGLKVNKWGDVDANPKNLEVENMIYSAGDCVTGAATVVEAVAGGYKAAMAILDKIAGNEHIEPPVINVSRGHWNSLKEDDLVFLKDVSSKERLTLPHISNEDRKNSFKEVTGTASKDDVLKEGERCIECSCTAKHTCKLKEHAEKNGATPDAIKGAKNIIKYDVRHPAIIFDGSKCIKCGICVKVCSEVVNKSLLGYKKRGFGTEIGTAFGKPLPVLCEECMKCVEECPVGALGKREKTE